MLLLKSNQKVSLTLKGTTSAGNDSNLDGIPFWGVENPSVVSLSVSPDGMSAVAFAENPGSTTIFCFADADLSDKVREVVGELLVNVLDSSVAEIQLTIK